MIQDQNNISLNEIYDFIFTNFKTLTNTHYNTILQYQPENNNLTKKLINHDKMNIQEAISLSISMSLYMCYHIL